MRKKAVPPDFQPLHGLRHTYTSLLASSGEVDLYVLQRLLTHKSAAMTQRHPHLIDDALQRASNLAGDLIGQTIICQWPPFDRKYALMPRYPLIKNYGEHYLVHRRRIPKPFSFVNSQFGFIFLSAGKNERAYKPREKEAN
jgi:hypothetical protein